MSNDSDWNNMWDSMNPTGRLQPSPMPHILDSSLNNRILENSVRNPDNQSVNQNSNNNSAHLNGRLVSSAVLFEDNPSYPNTDSSSSPTVGPIHARSSHPPYQPYTTHRIQSGSSHCQQTYENFSRRPNTYASMSLTVAPANVLSNHHIYHSYPTHQIQSGSSHEQQIYQFNTTKTKQSQEEKETSTRYTKDSIRKLIEETSQRVELFKPANVRSLHWENFLQVKIDNVKLPFVSCIICHRVLSWKSDSQTEGSETKGSGTNGMMKHNRAFHQTPAPGRTQQLNESSSSKGNDAQKHLINSPIEKRIDLGSTSASTTQSITIMNNSWNLSQNVDEWNADDVIEWLNRENLQDFQKTLKGITGSRLRQLYQWKSKSEPEYYIIVGCLVPFSTDSQVARGLTFDAALKKLFSSSNQFFHR